MRYWKKALFVIGGLFFAADTFASGAHAQPLTQGECAALRQQRSELEAKDVGNHVTKGAAWASTNLNAEQMQDVGSFLKLLENIRFRCGKASPDAKSKFGLHRDIPIPKRNPRRMQRKNTAKNNVKASVLSGSKIPPETKAVISAVTKGSAGAKADAAPKMRKMLGE